MSPLPDNMPALAVAPKYQNEAPQVTTEDGKRVDSVHSNDIEQMLAAKAKEDPLHVTKEDAARLESVEHKALGHRPPSGSVAAQVQAMADKVENFHKVADDIEQKLREHPSSVTKEDAQQVLSKEHKALGHYPPKDSISAAAQRVAAANERQAIKDEATKNGQSNDAAADKKNDADKEEEPSKDDASKDDASEHDGAKPEGTNTIAARRMSAVDKAKADQFKAKAFDVVIREARDALQKELEEEFSKTGEAKSVDKGVANKVMAEMTEAVELEKTKTEDVAAAPANGHVNKAE